MENASITLDSLADVDGFRFIVHDLGWFLQGLLAHASIPVRSYKYIGELQPMIFMISKQHD